MVVGGVWGEQPMAAHPQLSQDELEAIVEYILSVNEEKRRFQKEAWLYLVP